MPLCPIFNGDIHDSVLGVMHSPEDLKKARLYASWRLAKVTQSNDPALLQRVAKEAAELAPYLVECGEAEVAGSAVGAITSAIVQIHQPAREERDVGARNCDSAKQR